MFVSPRRPAKHRDYKLIERVEVYLKQDQLCHQGHCYAELKAITASFRHYENSNHSWELFRGKSEEFMGKVVLNGLGLNKARRKIEPILEDLGIDKDRIVYKGMSRQQEKDYLFI